MYREIDVLLRKTTVTFSHHPEANSMGQSDAEQQVYGQLRAELRIIHHRYYTASLRSVKALQRRWQSDLLVQIRDVQTETNTDALLFLDSPSEYQPTWDPYSGGKSGDRIPCPMMPKLAQLPDANVWTVVQASKIPFFKEERRNWCLPSLCSYTGVNRLEKSRPLSVASRVA